MKSMSKPGVVEADPAQPSEHNGAQFGVIQLEEGELSPFAFGPLASLRSLSPQIFNELRLTQPFSYQLLTQPSKFVYFRLGFRMAKMVQTTSNGVLPRQGSTTEAKLQLAHGGLCLALEHGQTVKLVLGDCDVTMPLSSHLLALLILGRSLVTCMKRVVNTIIDMATLPGSFFDPG